MKKEIIPAVLPKSFDDIEHIVRRLDRLGGVIQIDICDGSLVSSQTWPYQKNQLPEFKDDFQLPGWEDFDFEIDLMITNPELHIDNLKNMGFSRAVIHARSTSKEKFLEACKKLEAYDIEIGVGLENNNKNYADLLTLLDQEDVSYYIQVMGIDTIGKQGEPFSQSSFEFVKKIHLEYPETIIQVDGAVNSKTIQELNNVGVTRFVVGSWLKDGNIKDKIQELKNLIY